MIRAFLIVVFLVILIVILLPLHLIAMAFNLRLQRTLPRLFHRILCTVVGVRITEIGQRTTETPVLILANHVSWLDISVIGAVAPVVFVAKDEVAGWPVFGWLAKLQRTIFIERDRRHKTGEAASAMARSLLDGDAVLLFPEGTSSDGIRILPFRSALIGSLHHALGESTHHTHVTVQPMSLAYVSLGGVPIGRALRDRVAWYGDADLMPHLIGLLSCGAVDVTVTWGEAVAYDMTADRKQIARDTERAVRRMTSAALRAPAAGAAVTAAPMPELA